MPDNCVPECTVLYLTLVRVSTRPFCTRFYIILHNTRTGEHQTILYQAPKGARPLCTRMYRTLPYTLTCESQTVQYITTLTLVLQNIHYQTVHYTFLHSYWWVPDHFYRWARPFCTRLYRLKTRTVSTTRSFCTRQYITVPYACETSGLAVQTVPKVK